MKKGLLGVSLVSNFTLGCLYYLNSSTIQFNQKEISRIKGIYASDVKALKCLVENRIKKKELLSVFNSKLNKKDYFDKPSENGVGAGFLFFVFDRDETLKKVVQYDFAEKRL